MGSKEGESMSHAIVPVRPVRSWDIDQMTRWGTMMIESGVFPDTRAVAQAVVKIMAGHELGFGPVASMTGIHLIKGRITLSANLIAAAIRRSGRYDYRIERLDAQACEITFSLHGQAIGTA